MPDRQAIDIACDLYHRPLMAREVRGQTLPPGMLDVIKIAAGETPGRDGRLLSAALVPEQRQQAAAFFLQQALFQTRSDDWRLLGLSPGASREQIREHKRWLLKWLHPDRNPSKWESQLFLKVSTAAERLEKAAAEAGVEATSEKRPAAPAAPVRSDKGAPIAVARDGVRRRSKGLVSVTSARIPLERARTSRQWLRGTALAAGIAGLGLMGWSFVDGRPLMVLIQDLAQRPAAWLQAALQ